MLLHGFSRAPRHLRVLSERLNGRGVATVRPALSAWIWRRSNNNAAYLGQVAERLARGLPDGPVVVAGHSAGAAAGAWMAAELAARGVDVRRLVLVDGVENPTHLIARAWPRLAEVDVVAVLASPSPCNRHGQLGQWLRAQPRDVRILDIADSGHGAIEGFASAVYARACDDRSTDQTRELVISTVVEEVCAGLTRVR